MTFYVAKNKQTGEEILVEADVKTQAFRMVGESLIDVNVAKAEQIVKMLESGAKVMRKTDPQGNLQLEE